MYIAFLNTREDICSTLYVGQDLVRTESISEEYRRNVLLPQPAERSLMKRKFKADRALATGKKGREGGGGSRNDQVLSRDCFDCPCLLQIFSKSSV